MVVLDDQINIFSIVKPIINDVPDKCIPEGARLKLNQIWCPYCSSPVKFKKDSKLGVKKCPICGISEKDFNVRMINRLWK